MHLSVVAVLIVAATNGAGALEVVEGAEKISKESQEAEAQVLEKTQQTAGAEVLQRSSMTMLQKYIDHPELHEQAVQEHKEDMETAEHDQTEWIQKAMVNGFLEVGGQKMHLMTKDATALKTVLNLLAGDIHAKPEEPAATAMIQMDAEKQEMTAEGEQKKAEAKAEAMESSAAEAAQESMTAQSEQLKSMAVMGLQKYVDHAELHQQAVQEHADDIIDAEQQQKAWIADAAMNGAVNIMGQKMHLMTKDTNAIRSAMNFLAGDIHPKETEAASLVQTSTAAEEDDAPSSSNLFMEEAAEELQQEKKKRKNILSKHLQEVEQMETSAGSLLESEATVMKSATEMNALVKSASVLFKRALKKWEKAEQQLVTEVMGEAMEEKVSKLGRDAEVAQAELRDQAGASSDAFSLLEAAQHRIISTVAKQASQVVEARGEVYPSLESCTKQETDSKCMCVTDQACSHINGPTASKMCNVLAQSSCMD